MTFDRALRLGWLLLAAALLHVVSQFPTHFDVTLQGPTQDERRLYGMTSPVE